MDKIIYHFFSPESWFMITSVQIIAWRAENANSLPSCTDSYLQQDREKLCKIPTSFSLAFCPFPWDCEATMGTSLQRKKSRKIVVPFMFFFLCLFTFEVDLLIFCIQSLVRWRPTWTCTRPPEKVIFGVKIEISTIICNQTLQNLAWKISILAFLDTLFDIFFW